MIPMKYIKRLWDFRERKHDSLSYLYGGFQGAGTVLIILGAYDFNPATLLVSLVLLAAAKYCHAAKEPIE